MKKHSQLAKEQSFTRQKIAKTHGTRPSEFDLLFRSACSSCASKDIVWLSVDGYLKHLDGPAPQYVLDYPEGKGWVCLKCDDAGFMAGGGVIGGNSDSHSDAGAEAAFAEIHKHNQDEFILKFPEGTFGEVGAEVLDHFLLTLNINGLHKEYDLFFELVGTLTDRELELAGASIAREIKVNVEDFDALHSMMTLALLAAPVVNAFAPETNSAFQMPVLIKKLGKTLTDRWHSNEFNLLDGHRSNFVVGLLMTNLVSPSKTVGTGYYEDLYIQWLGSNFAALRDKANEVKAHGKLNLPAMRDWLGKAEVASYFSTLTAGTTSFLSSAQLEEFMEEVAADMEESGRAFDGTALLAEDKKHAFTIAQHAYFEGFSLAHGYLGESIPVYGLVQQLGLKGFREGGDGSTERLILALTAANPKEIEKLVPIVASLSEGDKRALAEVLGEDFLMKVVGQVMTSDGVSDLISRFILNTLSR